MKNYKFNESCGMHNEYGTCLQSFRLKIWKNKIRIRGFLYENEKCQAFRRNARFIDFLHQWLQPFQIHRLVNNRQISDGQYSTCFSLFYTKTGRRAWLSLYCFYSILWKI